MVRSEIAGLTACYLPEFYEAEQYITERLARMARTRIEPPRTLEKTLSGVQKKNAIQYAQSQLQALRDAASYQLLLVTGGPGTGKTVSYTHLDVYKRQAIILEPRRRGRNAHICHPFCFYRYTPSGGPLRNALRNSGSHTPPECRV